MRRSRLVRQRRIWYSGGPHFGNSLPMISCLKQWMGFASVFALRATTDTSLYPSYGLRASVVAASALLLLAAAPASAAGEADTLPKGAAVTVLKASKYCFGNIVEVSGIVLPRDEQQVRPDRFGLKVAEVKADPGDTVTAGQVLARLTDGTNAINLTAPVAGTISGSTAIVGAPASGKDALFSIIASATTRLGLSSFTDTTSPIRIPLKLTLPPLRRPDAGPSKITRKGLRCLVVCRLWNHSTKPNAAAITASVKAPIKT